MADPILVAKNARQALCLLPKMANRHGLITGATGTGKTVTLQRLAEGFSRIGVPVFLSDAKGDLSGLSQPGGGNKKVEERLAALGLEGFEYRGCPVAFWDVFGSQGHPVRATVSEMGPLLLGRMLGLNDTQQGVLNLAFKIADDAGLLLLDLKDLRALLNHVGENAQRFTTEYGHVSAASVGAIQRGLLALEQEGAEALFGEPALDIQDLMRLEGGEGVVNILGAERLMNAPRAYGAFLLWLLSELFENLPEVGDPEKPRLVFFFDEAHLLFDDAPEALLDKIEQVVRLIRSKGVGVYFVTQNPLDVPDRVLGQLGNRIQHALRAFTPRDQKAVKAAATTMRANPELDLEQAITELAVGEALVSLLDDKGRPGVTQRAFIVPPGSHIGPIPPEARERLIRASPLYGRYEQVIDRESAFEVLKARAEQAVERDENVASPGRSPAEPAGGLGGLLGTILGGGNGRRQSLPEAMIKSAARTIGAELGRQLLRGVLGGLLGGTRRRR